jgi:hypothetical protein
VVAVKAALAAQSPTPDMIAVEPDAYAVDVYASGSGADFDARSKHPELGCEMIKTLTGTWGIE